MMMTVNDSELEDWAHWVDFYDRKLGFRHTSINVKWFSLYFSVVVRHKDFRGSKQVMLNWWFLQRCSRICSYFYLVLFLPEKLLIKFKWIPGKIFYCIVFMYFSIYLTFLSFVALYGSPLSSLLLLICAALWSNPFVLNVLYKWSLSWVEF